MRPYRLVAEPEVDLDVEAAFDWYEGEQGGLGREFLHQLRAAYERIVKRPLQYQDLRSGVRRALVRRFPYAVIVVLAVLHASRDPEEWQKRAP